MDNPYQAPGAPVAGGPADPSLVPTRPTAVTVVAILGLLYGGLGLICNPINGIANLMSLSVELPPAADEITRLGMSTGYRTGLVVFSGVGFLTCALLTASAGGLLANKAWGRTLGLVYAATALVSLVANLVFAGIYFLGPLLTAAGAAANAAEKGRLYGGLVGGGGVLLIGFLFPIVYLAVLNLPATVAAYRPSHRGDGLA